MGEDAGLRVLVVGGGGREHALAWALARSPRVAEVLVAPGNAGTAREPGCRNVAIAAEDLDALLELAEAEDVDLTVVGPEAPLALGIVDLFEAAGRRILGPRRRAAEIESSKVFAKTFMQRHGIPTARFEIASSAERARAVLAEWSPPLVIKADGLAAGKGVIVATSREQAEEAIAHLFGGGLGVPVGRVVIEEFLEGEEASYIVLADGERFLPLPTSQDHKRRDEGDEGPNTGGMGACSPAPAIDAELERRIQERIVLPALRGLAAGRRAFRGFLYAGLMITPAGEPIVLEFNARLGDPEAQALLLRLEGDLAEALLAACEGRLAETTLAWSEEASVVAVLAAGGYPGPARRDDPVLGLDPPEEEGLKIFHAGTRLAEDGRVLSRGGRILGVAARGPTVGAARERVYRRLAGIRCEGAFYRRDIGWRAVLRETAVPLAAGEGE
ncbi:MAG: phosphoribosylamine--glycine ligase [Xanthomonadales bacterium]|nr:phosphoribosylamine--glycine ligase [Xanthomonadales bacterium]